MFTPKQVRPEGGPPKNQLQQKKENGDPEKTFPFQGNINRDQIGFHKQPRPGVDLQKDWIRPDLRQDEEVKVVGITANNWYIVERVIDGEIVTGYVDYRYITRIKEVTLKEVNIVRLSTQKVQICCKEVANLYMNDNIVSDADVSKALKKLESYYNKYHPSDFARIAICLKKRGALKVLLSNINKIHIENYFETLSYLTVFSPVGNTLDMIEGVMIYEGAKEAVNNIDSKDFLRYPTWDDWSPFESRDNMKKNLKKRGKDQAKKIMKEILANQDEIFELLDTVLKNSMELKAYELEIYWARKDKKEVRRIILEMNQLAEAGMEMLFSTDPQSKIANRTSVKMLMKLLDMNKGDLQMPNIYLDADVNQPLTDYYDIKKGKLIDPSQQTGGSQNTTGQTNQNKKPDPDAAFKEEAKTFIKELIVRLAESTHVFFHEDMVQMIGRSPGLLNYMNQVIRGSIKTDAYSKLSKGVKMDDSTDARTISPKSLKKMDWIDLARIWQYELGDSTLGQESNPITFSKHDTTTKDLRKHPSIKAIEGYAKARVKSGDLSPFTAQVKYDVSGFWNAVMANDVAFNFLGSFLVTVTPRVDGKHIDIEVYNKSGRESGTRFRRDPSKPNASNKIGIFSDVERTPKGQKPKDVPMGGDIHQKWKWKIKK